jgi:hypothetical protein
VDDEGLRERLIRSVAGKRLAAKTMKWAARHRSRSEGAIVASRAARFAPLAEAGAPTSELISLYDAVPDRRRARPTGERAGRAWRSRRAGQAASDRGERPRTTTCAALRCESSRSRVRTTARDAHVEQLRARFGAGRQRSGRCSAGSRRTAARARPHSSTDSSNQPHSVPALRSA